MKDSKLNLRNLHDSHTLGYWGIGTPKDRDEVNRRDVCECDGLVCVLEVIGSPSIFKLIRTTADVTRVRTPCF